MSTFPNNHFDVMHREIQSKILYSTDANRVKLVKSIINQDKEIYKIKKYEEKYNLELMNIIYERFKDVKYINSNLFHIIKEVKKEFLLNLVISKREEQMLKRELSKNNLTFKKRGRL